MLFGKTGDLLVPYQDYWEPLEKDLEDLIISTTTSEGTLDPNIFGEDLFFVGHQKRGGSKKILDIIALDRHAQAVIIELKKIKGRLGVETQALQYVSDASGYTGEDFIKEYKLEGMQDVLEGFFYAGIQIKDINQHSRIILLAREFDVALYSMGQWLANQGISFKCIKYAPLSIENNQYLNFSVCFDQNADQTHYRLDFKKRESREVENFWHNLGSSDADWLAYLYNAGQISASFSNQEGDRGEAILKNYIPGDTIFAYVSSVGCLGYGKIMKNRKYTLIKQGSARDVFHISGLHRHRLTIEWKAFLPQDKAFTAIELKNDFGIAHPIQTSSIIRKGDIDRLIKELEKRAQ